MISIVGRDAEKATLGKALASPESELLAVYGRRRVGKTFLIRQFFEDRISFALTGVSGAPLALQLGNFAQELGRAMAAGINPRTPISWHEAFNDLVAFLESLPPAREKRVIFFDELPWLASRKAGFLPALDHFWNSWATRRRDLVIVVCGSAASWMLTNVVHARGGLHNRVTRRLRLLPFTLSEARSFLEARRVKLDDYQTIELCMALGGIPHYLKEVEPGESAAQSIDRICFSTEGLLRDEFTALYKSLFEHAERHEGVMRALARKPLGSTRTDLSSAIDLPSGGGLTQLLDELEQAGFVMPTRRFGRQARDPVYRIADEYSLFYLKWIERHRGGGRNVWITRRGTPAWRAWSGLAFETMCLKHVLGLKRALGIEAVETTESTWRTAAVGGEPGAQIDLVIDRADRCINLCEMKFSDAPFVIDRRYAADLERKVATFRRLTATRKTVLLTLVTVNGLHDNEHARALVAKHIRADVMLRDG